MLKFLGATAEVNNSWRENMTFCACAVLNVIINISVYYFCHPRLSLPAIKKSKSAQQTYQDAIYGRIITHFSIQYSVFYLLSRFVMSDVIDIGQVLIADAV